MNYLTTLVRLLAIGIFLMQSLSLKSQIDSTIVICGSDPILESALSNPQTRQLWEYQEYENRIRIHIMGLTNPNSSYRTGEETYTIPVVFHVIYNPNLPVTSIGYDRILSQMDALNDEYSGINGSFDTHIRFCLAQNTLPASLGWTNPAEPGVMRYPSEDLSQHYRSPEESDMLIGLANSDWNNPTPEIFPFSRCLNVYVVQEIDAPNLPAGSTVAGYCPHPIDPSYHLDGVVVDYRFVGEGNFPNSNLNNNQGKILVHEIGHYFFLYHTFMGACSGISDTDPGTSCETHGDMVCDTPPSLNTNSCGITDGCMENVNYDNYQVNPYLEFPNPLDHTNAFDMNSNYMSYGHSNCKYTFTDGQDVRMLAYLLGPRATLLEPLTYSLTGISGPQGCLTPALLAEINTSNSLSCYGLPIGFSTNIGDGYLANAWDWDFGDGSAIEHGSFVNHLFAASGTYTVVLTAYYYDSPGDVNPDIMTNSVNINIEDCAPLNSYKGHWYFGKYFGIDFSSGIGTLDDAPYQYSTTNTLEGAISISDNDGNLLFYASGVKVWDKNHILVTNTSNQLHGDVSTAEYLCLKKPGTSNKYLLFTKTSDVFTFDLETWSINSEVDGLWYYSEVEVLANTVSVSPPVQIPCLPGITSVSEMINSVPHANGQDYWIITHGLYNDSNFYVYLLTAAGLTNADLSTYEGNGTLQPDVYESTVELLNISRSAISPNGLNLAISRGVTPSNIFGYGGNTDFGLTMYDIDNLTGALSNENQLSDLPHMACEFSLDSQKIFASRSDNSVLEGSADTPLPYNLVQYYLNGENVVPFPQFMMNFTDLQIGPDNRLYAIGHFVNDGEENAQIVIFQNATVDYLNGETTNIYFNAIPYTGNRTPKFEFPSFAKTNGDGLFDPEISGTYQNCNTISFSFQEQYSNFDQLWDFGDGDVLNIAAADAGADIIHSFGFTAGTVTLQLFQLGMFITTLTWDYEFATEVTPPIVGPLILCSGTEQEYVIYGEGFSNFNWTIVGGVFSNGLTTIIGSPVIVYWDDNYVGNHSLTAIGISNEYCSVSPSVLEANYFPLPDVSFTIDNACNGACIGSIETEIDAQSPWTVEWLGEDGYTSILPDILALCAGAYAITLIDANGCYYNEQVTVPEYEIGITVPEITYSTPLYVGLPINFNNSSTNENATYLWDFGDGQLSNDQNSQHIFDLPGVYLVTLSISDLCGLVTVQVELQISNPVPTFNFEYTGCNSAIFYTSEDFSAFDVLWEFGDGTIAENMTSIEHLFPDGSYNVNLTLSNGLSDFNYATTLYFYPDEPITVGGLVSVCQGYSDDEYFYEIANLQSEIDAYYWTLVDGTESQFFQDSPFEATSAWVEWGAENPMLIIEAIPVNVFCPTQEASFEIEYSPLPEMIVSITDDCVVGCGGAISIEYLNNNDNVFQTYAWTVTDAGIFHPWWSDAAISNNTLIENNVDEISGLCSELYIAYIHNSVSGCVYPASFALINLESSVNPAINVMDNCLSVGSEVSFFNTSNSGSVDFSWDFGDGEYSTDQNPVHTYLNSGLYHVGLDLLHQGSINIINSTTLVHEDCSSSTDIEVGVLPIANHLDISGSLFVCPVNTPIYYSVLNNSNNQDYYVTSWELNGGGNISQSTSSGVTVHWNTLGVHEVIAQAMHIESGCVLTFTYTVTVYSAPSFDVIVNSGCAGDGSCFGSVVFDVVNGIAPYTVMLYLPGMDLVGSYTFSGNTFDLGNLCDGSYYAKISDGNGCLVYQNGLEILEPNALDISIMNISNISCVGLSDGEATVDVFGGVSPYTYLWSNGNTNVTNTGLSTGNYFVTVTDANGCIATSSTEIFQADPITYSLGNPVGISCLEFNDIMLAGMIYGGSQPYTITDYNGLTAGITSGNLIVIEEAGAIPESITLVDSYGCLFMITTPDLTPIVVAEVEITGDLLVCNGETTTLTAVPLATNLGLNEFVWNGSSGQDPASITVGTGTYDVLMRDNLGCTDVAVVTVEEIAVNSTITFTTDCQMLPGSPIQFHNDDTTLGASYLWNFGDGQTSTSQNPSHMYMSVNTYNVSLTISIGTCLFTSTITVPIVPFTQSNAITISTQAQADALLINNNTYGGDITFEANTVEYVINGLTLYFGPQVGVIINESAMVSFKNCTLTSCGNWRGIKVLSDGSNNLAAGRLSVYAEGNGSSVIKHAVRAIETRDQRDLTGVPFYLYRAGRVSCSRTQFIDNLNSITIQFAYQMMYLITPHFSRCSFTVTDNLATHFPDNVGEYNQFRSHVTYHSVYSYNIGACSFRNEMTENPDIDVAQWVNRGSGITSNRSAFTLDRMPTIQYGVFDPGLFQGLDRGIIAYGSRIRVSGQVFKKNHIGALMQYCDGSRFYTNTFNVGEATGISYLDDQEYYGTYPQVSGNSNNLSEDLFTSYEGLVIYRGDFIEITENQFKGYPQANGGISDVWARLGTRIRATNTEEMKVYHNTFSKLTYANLANGDNAGGLDVNGLRYICNTNTLNYQDFTNTDFLDQIEDLSSPKVADLQMEPLGAFPIEVQLTNWPTGNKFSVENEAFATNFRNEGDVISEYWHSQSANQIPADYSGINALVSTTGISHSCPCTHCTTTVLHATTIIAGMIENGQLSKQDADQYRYLYLLLLDDGNTAALQQYVENTWGNQVWNTREQLLNISPFVTITVMMSVLGNTAVYPHAIAFEILLANPDLLEDPKLITYLGAKTDPMPQFMIDLLLENNTGTTSRKAMENTLGVKRTQYYKYVSEALWAMSDYDDGTYEKADFDAIFESVHSLNTEMFVVDNLLNDGLVTEATDRLAAIPTVVPFGRGETTEYAAFQTWVSLRQDMIANGRTWETMNAGDISSLETLMEAFDTYAAVQAMSVLNEYTETNYFVPPALGRAPMPKMARISVEELTQQLLEIYPNPADYLTTIGLKQPIPTTQICQLMVVDLLGKVVLDTTFNPLLRQVQVNTKDWAEGLYTFKIVLPNSSMQLNGKFEVLH